MFWYTYIKESRLKRLEKCNKINLKWSHYWKERYETLKAIEENRRINKLTYLKKLIKLKKLEWVTYKQISDKFDVQASYISQIINDYYKPKETVIDLFIYKLKWWK